MKKSLYTFALLTVPFAALATDVGVSVTIGQPGFYGHIDIGNVPAPQVINAQPVVLHPVPVGAQPVYLHVPPGHAKHWEKHCAEYNACGQRVYFVTDEWYNTVYVPQYQAQSPAAQPAEESAGHGRGKGRGHGNGRGHGRDED